MTIHDNFIPVIEADLEQVYSIYMQDAINPYMSYQSERLDLTAKLTLDNRKAGPERVFQMVEEACLGDCKETHHCVPCTQLEEVSLTYKKLAGFDKQTVNQ